MKEEQKYAIIVNQDQLHLIAQCLEDISRFACGQTELKYTIENIEGQEKITHEEQIKRRDLAEANLQMVKKILFPELLGNSSYGYNGNNFIGNTYQIYRSILHFIAIKDNWDNVYSSPALPSGNLGTIEIKTIK